MTRCSEMVEYSDSYKRQWAEVDVEALRNYLIYGVNVSNPPKIIYPQKNLIPPIEKVIFNGPATIVLWEDGEKTVVKCREEDDFSFEYGLAMAIAKRYFGSRAEFEKVVKAAYARCMRNRGFSNDWA